MPEEGERKKHDAHGMADFACSGGCQGWRLSPAFDLVPNIGFNREHVLRIGYDYRPPDLGTLLQEAGHIGLKRRQQTLKVLMEVHEAVSEWPAIFTANKVPAKDAESIGRDISRRLKETNPVPFV